MGQIGSRCLFTEEGAARAVLVWQHAVVTVVHVRVRTACRDHSALSGSSAEPSHQLLPTAPLLLGVLGHAVVPIMQVGRCCYVTSMSYTAFCIESYA